MGLLFGPKILGVKEIFREEIGHYSFDLVDLVEGNGCLYMRSTISELSIKVNNGDTLYGGIAIRAIDNEVWIHPYVFKKGSDNGVIIPSLIYSGYIRYSNLCIDQENFIQFTSQLREAISSCIAEDVFLKTTRILLSIEQENIDFSFTMLHVMNIFKKNIPSLVYQDIRRHFFSTNNPTKYSLMNAFTMVARDCDEAETRWQLESMGGNILFFTTPYVIHEDMETQPLAL